MTPTERLALSKRIAIGIAGRDDDIEDLVQDGVVAMLQAPPFDGRGSEEKYYGWRARNGMVDRIRVRPGFSRGQHVAPPMFVSLDAIVELSEPAAHDVEFEAEEQRTRVRRAIAALPLREREIVRLHYFQDQHQAKVARTVGLSPARISQLLAQAHGRLRVALSYEE